MSTLQPTKPPVIRVIAICIFRHDDRILVFEGFDAAKGTHYYRPLGGGVEAGEASKEALIREIREEVGAEIKDLRLLGVLESIFTVNERTGHEIVFVYDGRFVDMSIYNQPFVEAIEDNGDKLQATWRTLDSFDEQHRLVPEALMILLTKERTQ